MFDKIVELSRPQKIYTFNTANIQCMLDACGYKFTLRIYNTYCPSTPTADARTLLSTIIKRERIVVNEAKGNVNRPTLSLLLI